MRSSSFDLYRFLPSHAASVAQPSLPVRSSSSRSAPIIRTWLCCLLLTGVPLAHAGPQVKLTTNLGDIVLDLDTERAPETVANFLNYVDSEFYDGTIFHRVIDGFMIQGGGFDADYRRKPAEDPISNEATNGLSNVHYSVAMARTNAPHSATSQFFINTADNVNLDHTATTPRGWGYAVFGRVVEGTDIVDAISEVPTGPGGSFSRDAPREQVVIESVTRLEADASSSERSLPDPANPDDAEPAADSEGSDE